MLTQCAWAAARRRDSYLAAQFWRLARRIGKKKAAIAVGHSTLVIAWHLLATDGGDADLGGDYFVGRDATVLASGPLPNSRPSATRSPCNPSPMTGISLQEERECLYLGQLHGEGFAVRAGLVLP